MLKYISFSLVVALMSCGFSNQKANKIQGTWQLLYGEIIKGNDTVITNYTEGQKFLKIINESHFSFVRHDLNKGIDSTAVFVAGAGRYSFDGKIYKEHLEFCTGRKMEGNDFTFHVEIRNDTLVQKGIEKVEELNMNHEIMECYVRVKK